MPGIINRLQATTDRAFPSGSLSITLGATSTRATPWAYSGPTINTQNGLTVTGSQNGSYTLTKTGGVTDWTTGAYSSQRFTTCHLAWVPSQNNAYLMMGLSTYTSVPPFGNASDGSASYSTIGFAMYNSADGNIYCYENGSNVQTLLTGYTSSTICQMTYDGSNVRYYINYILVRTTACSGQSLAFDCSFYTIGGAVNSVDFGPGLYFVDASIIARGGGGATMVMSGKNGGITAVKSGGSNAWDSDFYGTQAFPTAHLSFKASQTDKNLMVGFSADPSASQNYQSIQYAWHPHGSGCHIYESGVGIGVTSYTTNTVFSITYDGSNVRYYLDGALQRTTAASGPLALDSSFYESSGCAINSLRFGPTMTSGEMSNPLATISATFRVLFASEEHAVQFFNTNGEIRILLNHPNTSTTQDQDWNTSLSSVNVALRQHTTVKNSGATGSAVSGKGFYQLTVSPQTIYDGTDAGAGNYSANYYAIEAYMNSITGSNGGNGADLRIRVYMIDDHTNNFFDTVNAGTTASVYYVKHSSVTAPTITVVDEF